DGFYKKTVQTVTYAPHFISVVVISGMIIAFLSPETGIINHALKFFGFDPIPFMEDPKWFKTVYVLSGVWQNTGWGTIIYLAALSGVDPQQHEAAIVDGASRLQRIWYINIPAIIPTMVILLILNVGNIMAMGFEKILLLQNPLNLESSNVIATFVYEAGLLDGQYSFAAAVGLFNAVINAILLISVNYIARETSETSLWYMSENMNNAIQDTAKDKVFKVFNYSFLTLAMVVVLYPLIYIISASISDPAAVNSGKMWLLPKDITFEGYRLIFQNSDIWR